MTDDSRDFDLIGLGWDPNRNILNPGDSNVNHGCEPLV